MSLKVIKIYLILFDIHLAYIFNILKQYPEVHKLIMCNAQIVGGDLIQCLILGGFTCTNACRICSVHVIFCEI